jgi:hypothetical protein
MQASEARQHKQTILNGIEAMGNNITKAISSEIHSTPMDVLNQASLDAIMKQLNASNHTKESSKSPTIDYMTTMSEIPSMPNPNPTPLRPKDNSPEDKGESKHFLPMPTRNGPKHSSFPTPGPTSRGHPCRPDPGGSDDNGGGSSGGGRRPPAGGDLDNNPGHNLETDREGDSPPLC